MAKGGLNEAVGAGSAVGQHALPANAAALRRAGIQQAPDQFADSGVLQHPRLAPLGHVFAVPAGWPLANVFGIGDRRPCNSPVPVGDLPSRHPAVPWTFVAALLATVLDTAALTTAGPRRGVGRVDASRLPDC